MNRFAKIVIVFSTASLLLAGVQPAGAVTQVTTHTKMKVSDTKIHKGDLVKFKIPLTASKAKCIKHMPIKFLKNGNLVVTKNTNDRGKLVIEKHPKNTAKWQAVFPGKKK